MNLFNSTPLNLTPQPLDLTPQPLNLFEPPRLFAENPWVTNCTGKMLNDLNAERLRKITPLVSSGRRNY